MRLKRHVLPKLSALVILGLFVMPILPVLSTSNAFAQTPPSSETTIVVDEVGTPCFLNYSAGYKIWQNCNAREDFMGFVLGPWEWFTGGYFSMIFIAIIIGAVYIKYHEIIYPLIIGILYLPFAYVLFPVQFVSWAIIMAFFGMGVLIWWVYTRQSR